jgi:hypothetical protein
MYAAMSRELRIVVRLCTALVAILGALACGGDSGSKTEPVDEIWDLTAHFDTVRTDAGVSCPESPCYAYAAKDSSMSGTVAVLDGQPRKVTLNGREYTRSGSTDPLCFLSLDGLSTCLGGTPTPSTWSGRIEWYDRAGSHASKYSGSFAATRRP